MRVMMVFSALLLAGCGQSEHAPRLDQSSGEWSCHTGGAAELRAMGDRITSIEWRDGVTIIEAEGLMFEQSARFYIWQMGYCIQTMPSPSAPAAPG